MMYTYKQISCQKAVAGVSFEQGVQDFNFQIGAPYGWIPNRSYFRIKMTLSGAAATPVFTDNLALADNVCANLYNNVYVRAGGQDISSIVNYVPQAAQVKMRTTASKAWLDGIGKSSFGCDPNFTSRQSRTSIMPAVLMDKKQKILLGPVGTTIAILAADGRVTGAAGSLLFTGQSKLVVGDQIVVEGSIFTVTDAATDNAGAGCVVTPFPAANIAATTDAYKIFHANDGSASNVVYMMWTPPCGIFDHASPMGSGDYRIQLNPNANYKKSAVQTLIAAVLPGAGFDLVVNDVQFYAATVNVAIPATGEEKLDLWELSIQSKALTSAGGENLLDFTVPPSTKAISIFVQSQDGGSNTLVPGTLFKCKDRSDEDLESLQISYAGQNKPDTRWTSEFKDNSINLMTQRYNDTQLYTGKFWSTGSGESFSDWLQRGGLYHFSWQRDQNDRSTHCQVSIKFAGVEANANLFVCAHYTKSNIITTENGYVTSVQSLAV